MNLDKYIKSITIEEILKEEKMPFVPVIGTIIDFYAALHPELFSSPDLAQYIANCVKEVNKIHQITPEDIKIFMED